MFSEPEDMMVIEIRLEQICLHQFIDRKKYESISAVKVRNVHFDENISLKKFVQGGL